MSRKNNNVRSKNAKGRLNRRDHGSNRAPIRQQPRVRSEDMILPDGQCTFQSNNRPKARFADKMKAEAALRQAQRQRARTGSGHVEKRTYKCPEGGCEGWHLTSREAFDDGVRKFRRDQYEAKTKNAARRGSAA